MFVQGDDNLLGIDVGPVKAPWLSWQQANMLHVVLTY